MLNPADLHDAGEDLARVLPPLLVEAAHLAASIAPGVHGRRRSGPGETFWQFRRYGSSDPATSIDWRQSARSDHLYVRETEWEAAQSILFWRDASPSMMFKSDGAPCSKGHRAAVLALALGTLLVRAGEKIGPVDGTLRPSAGPLAVKRLAEQMSTEQAPEPEPIPRAPRLPRSARLVLISDFLMDPDHLAARLRHFSGHGVRGHLCQVLDPAEEDLPFAGRIRFEDMETGQDYLAGQAESLRAAYLARLAEHRNLLAGLARRWGWTLSLHRTDRPASQALLALYELMAEARI